MHIVYAMSVSKQRTGSVRTSDQKERERNNMKEDGENLCMLLQEKTIGETVPIKIPSKDKGEIGISYCLK
jgi:hypothetical protein